MKIVSGKLQVHPDISEPVALHAGVDEFHAVQAFLDGGIGQSFVRFSLFQSQQILTEGAVDVAEGLEVSLMVGSRNANHTVALFAHVVSSGREEAGGFVDRCIFKDGRGLVVPFQGAFGTDHIDEGAALR